MYKSYTIASIDVTTYLVKIAQCLCHGLDAQARLLALKPMVQLQRLETDGDSWVDWCCPKQPMANKRDVRIFTILSCDIHLPQF